MRWDAQQLAWRCAPRLHRAVNSLGRTIGLVLCLSWASIVAASVQEPPPSQSNPIGLWSSKSAGLQIRSRSPLVVLLESTSGERRSWGIQRDIVDVNYQRQQVLDIAAKVDGFSQFSYLSIQLIDAQNRKWKVNLRHPKSNGTLHRTIPLNSPLFLLSNGWEKPTLGTVFKSMRVVVSGSVLTQALMECDVHLREGGPNTSSGVSPSLREASKILNAFQSRAKKDGSLFIDSIHQAAASGRPIPIIPQGGHDERAQSEFYYSPGHPPTSSLPAIRFRYHALTHVLGLLLAYEQFGDQRSLNLATIATREWLEAEDLGKTDDATFAWYDHGVGIRAIAMLLLAAELKVVGEDYGFSWSPSLAIGSSLGIRAF